MEKIEIKNLKRNPDKIKKLIKTVGDMAIAKENLYIIFPQKFVDKELSILDNICEILGVVMIMDDDYNYSVMTIPGKLTTEPNEIETVEIDNELYVQLVIEKDNTLITSNKIVKNTDLIYQIFELLMLQGKVPFYLNYIDLFNVFSNIPKYTGSDVGIDTLGFEVLIAISARNPNNLDMQFRKFIKTEKDMINKNPKWVGLKNIYYSYNSTLSKIAGSYFKKGLVAAIVKPEDKSTTLENILRK